MAKTSQPATGRVRAGSRRVEEVNGSSLRVTLPSVVVSQMLLQAGEEVLVAATESGEVAIHPAGHPLIPSVALLGGNVTLHRHNGCLKATLAGGVTEAVGITAGDEPGFEFEPGGCVYVLPEA